jgi:hypothetical protein
MTTTTEATDRATLYRVKGWDSHFEGSKSKGYKNKSSCMMPCSHGLGYKRLVRAKNGASLFGAWCAMIQVLSQHQPPREGWVTDDGKHDGAPYTPDDLECLTDIPSKTFGAMLDSVSSQVVDWVEVVTQGYHSTLTGDHSTKSVPLNSNLDLDLNSDRAAGGDGSFDDFWEVYPKKIGKQAAQKAWQKHAKSIPPIDTVVLKVRELARSEQWAKDCGQYIPNPATWLNRGGWDDEVMGGAVDRHPTRANCDADGNPIFQC